MTSVATAESPVASATVGDAIPNAPVTKTPDAEPRATGGTTGGTVRCEGGRVWVENVDRLVWGDGRDSSFVGALAAALKACGRDLGYDYLMGASAHGFRLQLAQPEWCPSAPYAGNGFDATVHAARAAGVTLSILRADETDAAAVNKRREAVVRSIERGIPVLYLGDEAGLVVGYDDAGRTILRRTYHDQTAEPTPAQTWDGAAAGIIELTSEPPSRRDAAVRSLELALELAATPRYGDYASGVAAYEMWVAQLRDESRFANIEAGAGGGSLDPDIEYAMIANAWTYTSLVDARAAAGRYLRSVAGEFPPRVSGRLMRAAELYEDLSRKLALSRRNVPFPWDLSADRAWTQSMRDAQARSLGQAVTIEQKAVEELGEALKAVESERPAPKFHRRPARTTPIFRPTGAQ